MQTNLDLHDIQGNIVKGYGRYGFPKARYLFFHITHEKKAREFILKIVDDITTSAPWTPEGSVEDGTGIPNVTTNIAFTYGGLKALGLPRKSLQSFPVEYVMGMQARRDIVGDTGRSAPENWDPIWTNGDFPVHMWLSINGRSVEDIEQRQKKLADLMAAGGLLQLSGHSGPSEDYQDASALYVNGKPSPFEHFGYVDGISDPYFKGSLADPSRLIGGGKPTRKAPETADGWEAIETGEFILGHRDELCEYPKAPKPRLLSLNGTFMVYRKLHQNVASFNSYMENMGQDYPGGKELLAAKFAGRWKNGAPLTTFPTEESANQFALKLFDAKQKLEQAKTPDERKQKQVLYNELKKQLTAFNFNNDIEGGKCPVGAHIRRANPRGSLEFGVDDAFDTIAALTMRRRILRRGLPYGEVKDPNRDDGNHGIIFMAINASIERQFEFVQQQWINYGNDFRLANDRDPLIGNQPMDKEGNPAGRMTLQTDPNGNDVPFFCSRMPSFVETRGGDYFFIPSITSLRMIGEGTIDPT